MLEEVKTLLPYVTKEAFWARFTPEEIVAINEAVVAEESNIGKNTIGFTHSYNKLNIDSNIISLDSSDTFSGVIDLGLRGIITRERAMAILTDPIKPEEQVIKYVDPKLVT
jgi:hypothetical protein